MAAEKKFQLNQKIFVYFHRATPESIMTLSIIVWYGSKTKQQKQKLKGIQTTDERIIGLELPALASL